PTGAFCPLSEALTILRAVVVENVVFPRHIKHLARLAALQDLLKRVEFLGLSQVREVAGVEHEGGTVWERVDLRDGLAQRAHDVFVCILVKTDMAVADLNET